MSLFLNWFSFSLIAWACSSVVFPSSPETFLCVHSQSFPGPRRSLRVSWEEWRDGPQDPLSPLYCRGGRAELPQILLLLELKFSS